MPADDVSDLKDVFDAINKLCETMKTCNYEEAHYVECSDALASPGEDSWSAAVVRSPDSEDRSDAECAARSQFVSAEDLSIQRMETQRQKWRESQASLASCEVSVQRELAQERWSDTQVSPPSSDSAARESCSQRAERWSDCQVSPPGLAEDAETIASDTEPAAAQCEPTSDLYYTASSDVSLVSDSEPPERESDKEGKGVIAGHVAAMRERFESMTRANTPCPDTVRSASPALDATIPPSPDFLG